VAGAPKGRAKLISQDRSSTPSTLRVPEELEGGAGQGTQKQRPCVEWCGLPIPREPRSSHCLISFGRRYYR